MYPRPHEHPAYRLSPRRKRRIAWRFALTVCGSSTMLLGGAYLCGGLYDE